MCLRETTFRAMKAVPGRELKNRLSAYLRGVARGEVALVTDRGRVVTELHLASTTVLRDSLPGLVILSTDQRVRENSAQVGFEVRPASLAG
jgi:antitoxin (DNA-binding transcriptional repressor) of toxin-antitoxin stability system